MEVEGISLLPEIELPIALLPYIRAWRSKVDETAVEKYKDHSLKVRTAHPRLWRWIFDVLSAYDRQIRILPLDKEPKLHGLSELTLYKHYTLLLIVHTQDIVVLYVPLLEAVTNKLRSLSLLEINKNHKLAPLLPFVPTTYKERIALEYSRWHDRVRQVITHYLANDVVLVNALMSRLPSVGYLVGVGIGHSLAITSKGVYSAGSNEYAQLGVPREESASSSEEEESESSESLSGFEGLSRDRNVFLKHGKVQVSNAVAVACGHSSSMILTSDGLYFAGENVFKQSGLGKEATELVELQKVAIDGVLAVAMGQSHSMILTTTGLFGVGHNRFNQLGLGEGFPDVVQTPTKVVFVGGENIKAVFCGGEHTMILNEEGELFACGNNANGQCGVGTLENVASPARVLLPEGTKVASVALGLAHSLILTDKGEVYSCGANSKYQLSTGDTDHRSTPFAINTILPLDFETVSAVSAGRKHSLFLTSDEGHVISIGDDHHGQLATGVSRSEQWPAKLPKTFSGILEMVSGGDTSFFITEKGLYGAGENVTGLLGLNHTKNMSVPTKIPLLLGNENTITQIVVDNNNNNNNNNNKKTKAEEDIGADRPKKEQRLKCTVCWNEAVVVGTKPQSLLFCNACFENLYGPLVQ